MMDKMQNHILNSTQMKKFFSNVLDSARPIFC